MDNLSEHLLIGDFLRPVLLVVTPTTITILVIVILFLLLISFFVSGAKVALFSLSYRDINTLKTKQDMGGMRIVNLLNEPRTLQGSLMVANTVINIAIIILANFLIDQVIPMQLDHWLLLVLKILIIAATLTLFGEVLPKVWATQNNLRFALYGLFLIEIVYYLFKRAGAKVVSWTDRIEKMVGGKTAAGRMEQLDEDIDVTSGKATEEERNILKSIVKFTTITVKQIMRTRLDVCGIDHAVYFQDLKRRLEELHYSRLPVYKENLDNIVGLIHTKDIIPYLHESPDFEWQTLIRPPYFVHEQKFIADLLEEFKERRIHFAIVVDEFGGTSGIVTLEDILEEIIGDIRDEFDDEESANKKIDELNYIFEGRTMLHDACRLMSLPVDTFDSVKGESDSLAGLILEHAGDIPKLNDVIVIGDFEFAILEVDLNRIRRVKVTIKPPLS